jgi:hypothetical protein
MKLTEFRLPNSDFSSYVRYLRDGDPTTTEPNR